ncbi:MAG: Asp-tRNA(Asn)/Glu-tRNA(Gln) amidotransferase subunit GatB [Candidatus Omnitrophica bacterium]|nr:Asp-tRNA(Asn)/Glu-tRNA(Gln) amidotransferase subunit GatB [Candidatus Omnitrophota bacterium]
MNQLKQEFETVIGLEVHLQLNTATKIFCGCANVFGDDPNTNTCPVCLGLPGTLPVLNKQALFSSIKIGLALNCQINPYIKFDRKNYYYPDLPKGYQISQFDLPVAWDGHIDISVGNGQKKTIRIKRAHMEEDAGKLIHDNNADCSLVDYNRTGTPLMEIVTEPDLRFSQEAYDYLHILKLTLQYLNISDCDMEKGSLRCDANISIRPKGQTTLGTKTELKNMNSFKAVKAALEYEEKRHRKVILDGGQISQETLLWDENRQRTLTMRTKEDAHDYRYFSEPDLVPFVVDEKAIQDIKNSLPENPDEKLERFIRDYELSSYDAGILVADLSLANFFEDCAKMYPDTKKICNWINGALLQELNARKLNLKDIDLSVNDFIAIIKKVDGNILSNLAAKDALRYVIDTGKSTEEIIKEKGLAQVSDEGSLLVVIDEVIKENETVVQEIKSGKESAIGFLIGQAMRKTKGKANPKKVGDLIKQKLL